LLFLAALALTLGLLPLPLSSCAGGICAVLGLGMLTGGLVVGPRRASALVTAHCHQRDHEGRDDGEERQDATAWHGE
jgi:hypothetical protein